MRLVHGEYGLKLELEENQVQVVVVENGKILYQLMYELYSQSMGEDGRFVLSEKDSIKKLSRFMAVILEPFTLDCNEKRILSKLYQELETLGVSEFAEDAGHICTEFVKYIDKLAMQVPYPVTYNLEFDHRSLLKMFDVKMEEQNGSILEKIITYLQILRQLCNVEVVAFLNLKSFLAEQELNGLYEFAFYSKIQLVLWENVMRHRMSQEQVTIIDQDCCIIHC